MSALIELRGVTKKYGAFTALDNLTFSLSGSPPSITAVAGESGSGKTTFARIVLGFIPPSSGQVFYLGKDIARLSAAERQQFRREVQPIFQDPFDVFNPFYRVDHVLTVPVRRFRLADSEAAGQRLIEDALSRVGLRPKDTLGRFPHELSGGQRQRIMVARAVLTRPKLIMADEPVSMVDASLRATILDELSALTRDLGISIVYITHDLTTAYQICENILILYQGCVAEAGSVDRVIRDPKHPYTRLLVSSIPMPDRTRIWGGEELKVPEASAGRLANGCRFAPRCPFVLEECWSDPPPKFQLDADRIATCFLHKKSPISPDADVAGAFAASPTIVNGPPTRAQQ